MTQVPGACGHRLPLQHNDSSLKAITCGRVFRCFRRGLSHCCQARSSGAQHLTRLWPCTTRIYFSQSTSPLPGYLNSLAQLSGQQSAAGTFSHSHSHSRSQPGHTEHTANVSIDPQAPGQGIIVIHSPQELAHILADSPGTLVCLMCKAIGCRPCKVFARKYQRIAKAYQHCTFLECTGDETIELRKLMIQMGIRSTPTFRLYRRGECVKTHVGIDDQKLRDALDSCLEEGESTQTTPEARGES